MRGDVRGDVHDGRDKGGEAASVKLALISSSGKDPYGESDSKTEAAPQIKLLIGRPDNVPRP